MRGWMLLLGAVTLVLLVVIGFYSGELWTGLYSAARAAWLALVIGVGALGLGLSLVTGVGGLGPWLLVAGVVGSGALLVWSHLRPLAGGGDGPGEPSAAMREEMSLRQDAEDQPAPDETGSRRADLGCLASLLVPLLLVLVGTIAYNVRFVSCSMPDQAACPQVGYDDIRLPEDDGIANPYSMDFREPGWPASTRHNADWLVLYRTWGDDDWWAACRRLSDESVACSMIDSVGEFPGSVP